MARDYSVYYAHSESLGHELGDFVDSGKGTHRATCVKCEAVALLVDGEQVQGLALKASCMGRPIAQGDIVFVPSKEARAAARKAEAERKRERDKRRKEANKLAMVCEDCGYGSTLVGRGCYKCKVGNYSMLERTTGHRNTTPIRSAQAQASTAQQLERERRAALRTTSTPLRPSTGTAYKSSTKRNG